MVQTWVWAEKEHCGLVWVKWALAEEPVRWEPHLPQAEVISDPLQSQRPRGRDCCVRAGLSMKEAVVGGQGLMRTSRMSLALWRSPLQSLAWSIWGSGQSEHRSLSRACWKGKSLSHVRLFATPWTIQCIEFSRPEYWSGLPFPSPGDLPNPGMEPRSPALQADSLPAEPPGKPSAS